MTIRFLILVLSFSVMACEPMDASVPTVTPKSQKTNDLIPAQPAATQTPTPVPANLRANHPLALACDKGNMQACVSVASKLLLGRDVKRSILKSEYYYKKACTQKYKQGCHGWGVLLRDIVKSRDAQIKAFSLFKKNCEDNFWPSCSNQAHMTTRGEGTIRDVPVGYELARKTCEEKKEPYSCKVMGDLLLTGQRWGIKQDKIKAVGILSIACKGRAWESCAQLAQLHHEGQATPKNDVRARGYYARACENGFRSIGCTSYAQMLRQGTGGKVDLAKAYQVDEKACKAGRKLSCISFAESLIKGWGIKKSGSTTKRGVAILRQHCEQNNKIACAKLKLLQ